MNACPRRRSGDELLSELSRQVTTSAQAAASSFADGDACLGRSQGFQHGNLGSTPDAFLCLTDK